jgi:hypothetical protein
VGIKVVASKGDTPDDQVNEFHRDLVELSATKVVALTKEVFANNLEVGRVDKATLTESIVQAVRDRRIPVAQLNRRLRATVEPLVELNDDDGGQAEHPRTPR